MATPLPSLAPAGGDGGAVAGAGAGAAEANAGSDATAALVSRLAESLSLKALDQGDLATVLRAALNLEQQQLERDGERAGAGEGGLLPDDPQLALSPASAALKLHQQERGLGSPAPGSGGAWGKDVTSYDLVQRALDLCIREDSDEIAFLCRKNCSDFVLTMDELSGLRQEARALRTNVEEHCDLMVRKGEPALKLLQDLSGCVQTIEAYSDARSALETTQEVRPAARARFLSFFFTPSLPHARAPMPVLSPALHVNH